MLFTQKLLSIGFLEPSVFQLLLHEKGLGRLGNACELPPCYLRGVAFATKAWSLLQDANPKQYWEQPSQGTHRLPLLCTNHRNLEILPPASP